MDVIEIQVPAITWVNTDEYVNKVTLVKDSEANFLNEQGMGA